MGRRIFEIFVGMREQAGFGGPAVARGRETSQATRTTVARTGRHAGGADQLLVHAAMPTRSKSRRTRCQVLAFTVVATAAGVVAQSELTVPDNAVVLDYAAHDPILRGAALVVMHDPRPCRDQRYVAAAVQ